jgi:SAP domain
MEVTVKVPADTRAKNIIFKPTAKSVDLRYKSDNGDEVVLMDRSRKLRGRVNLDGTYWVISDLQNDFSQREVTVTIEKIIRTPKDDFEVVDYDWKGVFVDDKAEVSSRKYDKPDNLDVREYAASLGVDIDNINMSMVDKTMFSSGMNMTQKSLDELTKAGYLSDKEVTRQADGSEYLPNDDGELERIPAMDKDEGEVKTRPKIPFLDTNSPWHDAVPVVVDKETNKTYVQQTRNFTRAAYASDSAKEVNEETLDPNDAIDPIGTLTVKRLKEILKSQGLKTSGAKQELQDRLRKQVNSLMQGKQQSPE